MASGWHAGVLTGDGPPRRTILWLPATTEDRHPGWYSLDDRGLIRAFPHEVRDAYPIDLTADNITTTRTVALPGYTPLAQFMTDDEISPRHLTNCNFCAALILDGPDEIRTHARWHRDHG